MIVGTVGGAGQARCDSKYGYQAKTAPRISEAQNRSICKQTDRHRPPVKPKAACGRQKISAANLSRIPISYRIIFWGVGPIPISYRILILGVKPIPISYRIPFLGVGPIPISYRIPNLNDKPIPIPYRIPKNRVLV